MIEVVILTTLIRPAEALEKFRRQLETEIATGLMKLVTESTARGLKHDREVWNEDSYGHEGCQHGEYVFRYISQFSESKLWPIAPTTWIFPISCGT
jgi:hypothetical protein